MFLFFVVISCNQFLNSDSITKQEKKTINNITSPWSSKASGATMLVYWNDDNWFHFLFNVEDKTLVLSENKSDKEQNVLYSDRVELFFTKDSLLQPYYTLEMDASARLFDAKCRKGENPKIDETWDWPKEDIEIKSKLTRNGYVLEGKISIRSLNEFGLIKDNTILCGVMRANFLNKNEVQWLTWKDPKTKKPDFHNWGVFGELVID